MKVNVGSICLVAQEFADLAEDHGLGTYFWNLAHILSREGWSVHVLYCGLVENPGVLADVHRRLDKSGIAFSGLDTFTTPKCLTIPTVFSEPEYLLRSEKTRYALTELHRERQFDLLEFAESDAVGFRTIQAKISGEAFRNVGIITKLHGSSQWTREEKQAWMENADDLRRDFCERYAFDNSDVQLSSTRYMLDYARSIHWKVRPDAHVLPNPFPAPLFDLSVEYELAAPEIVFLGRLDTLGGLEILVAAAKNLDPTIPLSFVGKDARLANGGLASEYLRSHLNGRKVSLITTLDPEQALTYLSKGNRLAVLPSLAENFPYTAIKCAVNGIPFVASRVGAISEILPDAELQAKLLFEPNPRDLLRCLKRYLQADASQRRASSKQARDLADVRANHRQLVEGYSQMLQPQHAQSFAAAHSMEDDPLVTLCVSFYNLGRYLPDALASLAGQTYRNLEVLVINDGSTDDASARVFETQQQLYPQFRFVSQANAGPCATRNRGIAEAKGDFFIPMDADNIATPQMVERFVAGIRARPDVSALTCYYLAFKETADIAQMDFCYTFRPTGGSFVLGSLENIYGDTNSIYRIADLRAVGGFNTDRDTGHQDWELFVKLVSARFQVAVLPEYLFYYRHREDSLVRTTNSYRNRQRVLRQYFRAERLPEVEQMALWTALHSLHVRLAQYHCRQSSDRYRIADEVADFLEKFPHLSRLMWGLFLLGWRMWKRARSMLRRGH